MIPHPVSLVSLIAESTSDGDVRVVAIVGGLRKTFTGMRAVRMRDNIRQLEAAIARPEGEQRG